jgi:hypothetical protein
VRASAAAKPAEDERSTTGASLAAHEAARTFVPAGTSATSAP